MSPAMLCAAAALLVWPRTRRYVGSPLRWDALGRIPAARASGVLAVAAAAVAGIASTPLVAALTAAAVVAGGRVWRRRRDAVVEERRLRALAEALGAFAADLRAGRPVEEADRKSVV